MEIWSSGDSSGNYKPIGITDIHIGNQRIGDDCLTGRTLNLQCRIDRNSHYRYFGTTQSVDSRHSLNFLNTRCKENIRLFC